MHLYTRAVMIQLEARLDTVIRSLQPNFAGCLVDGGAQRRSKQHPLASLVQDKPGQVYHTKPQAMKGLAPMQPYQEPPQEPPYQPPPQEPFYQPPPPPYQENQPPQQPYQEQSFYQRSYQEQPSYQPTQQAYPQQTYQERYRESAPGYQAAQQAYQQPQSMYQPGYQPTYPPGYPPYPAVGQKDWLLTLLLCLFLGVFGIHRFYTGHILIGLIQLFTFGLCGIWTLIDLILIATDNYKDANGLPLRKP